MLEILIIYIYIYKIVVCVLIMDMGERGGGLIKIGECLLLEISGVFFCFY